MWRVLAFRPERFDAELFALCRAVPLLDHLLCWIDAAHFPILQADRVLRNLHAELARDGRFEIRLHGTAATLHSERSVMLEDKSVFFSVAGRADLVLAAGRVGFGHPLIAVLLPAEHVVIAVQGEHWNIGPAQAERAMRLLSAAPVGAAPASPLLVTGDANFAHHAWNQLGALDAVLAHGGRLVAVTHQPLGPLAEIFADRSGLTVRAFPAAHLPRLDPRVALPFPAGGKVVVARVRDRIQRVARARAPAAARDFVSATRGLRRIWLTVRVQERSALNLLDLLTEIAASLLAAPGFAIVLDGYSRPHDLATNAGYDTVFIERCIAKELVFANALRAAVAARLGTNALARLHNGIGADLPQSIFLASNCHAYFAHHGTLQHKIGYFTRAPGMVHSNPGILAFDRAGTLRHVMEEPGVIEYVDARFIDAVEGPGSEGALDHRNSYRFNDVSAVAASFRAFVDRCASGLP